MIYLRLLVLTLCVAFFASSSIQAQDYSSSVGLRLGVPNSISYKMFLNESGHAVEGYVSFRSEKIGNSRYSWVGVSGAYQIHNQIPSVDGLYWYYGGGASVFFWSFDNDFINVSDQNTLTFGIQGYLGLDYTFDGLPINLSLDWIPTFFINGYSDGFGGRYANLAVRYTLD